MVKGVVFLVLFCYFFVLLQTSFLAHFNLWGYVPNLILISVILLNIFSSNVKLNIESAAIGGFFLDIFSSNFFGFWIFILLAATLVIKFALHKYVRVPFIQRL